MRGAIDKERDIYYGITVRGYVQVNCCFRVLGNGVGKFHKRKSFHKLNPRKIFNFVYSVRDIGIDGKNVFANSSRIERSSSERSGIAREISSLLTFATRLPANGWPAWLAGQRDTHVPIKKERKKERNERWSWFNEVRAERAAACLRVAFSVLRVFSPLRSRPE